LGRLGEGPEDREVREREGERKGGRLMRERENECLGVLGEQFGVCWVRG
jgi:hypothetical protein